MEYFFKNVTKSIKKMFEMYPINHLWKTSFKNSKISIRKLIIHEIKHIPKPKKDWLQALYESFCCLVFSCYAFIF